MSDGEMTGGVQADGPEARARPAAAARAQGGDPELARERLALLADISRRLSTSLEYETTLAIIASMALRRSGDWSIVDLLDADGTVHRCNIIHPDPEKSEAVHRLQQAAPPRIGVESGHARVMQSGRLERFAIDDAGARAPLTDNGEQLDILRTLGARAFVVAPMIAQGTVLGAMTFVRASDDDPITDEDMILAEDLASRAALAIENTRLHRAATSSSAATREAMERAEQAGRHKSEFLTTMSHEFRTPLNAILGYAQILDMGVLGPTTPSQHSHLERLQASARHLLQLVDDVLDVAKVDADRFEVHEETLATGASVAAAVALVQPQATAKGIRLVDLGSDVLGYAYVGDERRVRQILVNLLSNAVKFTPSGGEITLICGSTDAPDPGTRLGANATEESRGRIPRAQSGWVYIRVTDTGPGISPEFMSRLFEPFVQADGALTREKGGTGLGLAISRRLARRMGGDLTAYSRLGAGATFTLWLPSPQTTPVPSESQEPSHSADRHTPSSTRAIRGADAANLDATAYAVLYAIGTRLARDAETISERYVQALRADGRFPGAHELRAAQLRDHATPFVGLLASQLIILGETKGEDPDLLADGGHVQRLMAELHGTQRHRLGWSEADIERETQLLFSEVEAAIRGSIDESATISVMAERSPGSSPAVDASSRAALQYALDIANRVLSQAAHTTLRSYRFAKDADAR